MLKEVELSRGKAQLQSVWASFPMGFGVKVVSHHTPVLLKWVLE